MLRHERHDGERTLKSDRLGSRETDAAIVTKKPRAVTDL